jgi:arylsulfatase A-like enzyme
LLPTFAKLTGSKLSTNKIDGLDIWPLLAGQKDAHSPHNALLFYWGNELHAIRSGPWKLHLPHPYIRPVPPGLGGQPGRMMDLESPAALYNLEKDPWERRNVIRDARNLDERRRLFQYAEDASIDLGDALTKRKGTGVREPAKTAETANLR